MYVDDTNFLFCGDINNLDVIHDNTYFDMRNVNKWMTENSLGLYSDKTKLMMISTKSRILSICDFSCSFNSVVIKNSDKLKCLGITIDCSLTSEAHINNKTCLTAARDQKGCI